MRHAALALALALAPAAAFAASIGVPLDQSIRVGLSAPARDVIVGNPSIADVSISDQRHVVVTGKTAGVTNLIVTDEAGRTILNSELVVTRSAGYQVSLINGPTVVGYACAPTCGVVASEQAPGAPPPTTSPAPGSTTFTISPPTPAPNTSAIQASPTVP